MRRIVTVAVVAGLALGTLPGCGSEVPVRVARGTTVVVRVEEPWARAVPAPGPGGVFLTVVNDGPEPDAIVGAAPAPGSADHIELHQSVVSGGGTGMSPVTEIPVPARGRVHLRPGGYHLMLAGLDRDLSEGDRVEFTLQLARAGRLQVSAPVRWGDPAEPTGHDHSQEGHGS